MLAIEVQNRIKQFNPWITNPDKAESFLERFFPKEYVPRRVEPITIRPDRALLVVGPRQSGKSTLIWHLLRPMGSQVLFLNMEDPLLRIACTAAVELASHLQEKYQFIKAVFLDEIQHQEEAGLFIKGLIDLKFHIPLLVTGSSSFHLRSKTRESLAGRATRKLLLPFSLDELIKHKKPQNPAALEALGEEILTHQLVLGSYPAVILEKDDHQKKAILSDLVEALILRDASDLFKIKRVDAFRKLLTLLAGQVGSLVNISEIAALCQVDVGTINAYLEILEETHIVKKAYPFAGGKRREITGAPKIFFLDNGIRNQLLNSFSPELDLRTDKGALFENWVFAEINKWLPSQGMVKFWRSKAGAEIDFVIEYGGNLFALEAKYSALKKAALSRSLSSFLDAYGPKRMGIINRTFTQDVALGNQMINFITPLGLSEWLAAILEPPIP